MSSAMESPESRTEGSAGETPNQKQARLRRERREAKIKAGGSARLDKITNVSGRNLPEQPPTLSPAVSPSIHNDPEEVDLSTHPSARNPDPSNGGPTGADIRSLLRAPPPGGDIQQQQQQRQRQQQQQQGEDDPVMKMLQQFMGGIPSAEGQDGEAEGGLPPGLAAMLGAGGMGVPGMGGPQAQQDGGYGYLWKIVHAVLALILGVYVTATSNAFSGDISRNAIAEARQQGGINLFWVFATAELVLQSSRFFLEKGRGSPLGGWIGIAGNLLPEPWKGWLRLAGRYSGIWTTVVEDGMVIVFVVGCMAWWKGAVG